MNRKQAIALALAIAGTSAFAQEATSDIWMHAQSNKSFEQVRGELVQARKDGTIKFGSAGYMEKVSSVKSRDQVRAEVAAARRSGELDAIDSEAYAFVPAGKSPTTLASK